MRALTRDPILCHDRKIISDRVSLETFCHRPRSAPPHWPVCRASLCPVPLASHLIIRPAHRDAHGQDTANVPLLFSRCNRRSNNLPCSPLRFTQTDARNPRARPAGSATHCAPAPAPYPPVARSGLSPPAARTGTVIAHHKSATRAPLSSKLTRLTGTNCDQSTTSAQLVYIPIIQNLPYANTRTRPA